MTDSFKTIELPAEGLYKEKGSKFYSFAYPVVSEDEVTKLHKSLKKKYYDARHHCYAFIIGPEQKSYRASDDGEPSNSSGPPILGQIRSKGLTNILVVVVRYFGGTKLGVPGLIHAYKSATDDALANANIIEKTVDDKIEICFGYPHMNLVMKILKDEDLKPMAQDFQMDCRIETDVRKSKTEGVLNKLNEIYGVNAEVK